MQVKPILITGIAVALAGVAGAETIGEFYSQFTTDQLYFMCLDGDTIACEFFDERSGY